MITVELLHTNLEDLINARSVESYRLEYKTSWNNAAELSILKTICAFANDLYNNDGGYILLGIAALAANDGPT